MRNKAPVVRKGIVAPVTICGQEMRIERSRYCPWCEIVTGTKKEARRKKQLSGTSANPTPTAGQSFHQLRSCEKLADIFLPTHHEEIFSHFYQTRQIKRELRYLARLHHFRHCENFLPSSFTRLRRNPKSTINTVTCWQFLLRTR